MKGLGWIPACVLVAFALTAATAQAAPPPNDNFAQAQTLTAPSVVIGTTAGATSEPGEPAATTPDPIYGNPFPAHSVWYRFTAPSNGLATLELCGSGDDNDIVVGVFTGSAVAGLTRIADDDDACTGIAGPSEVSFDATAGTTYPIAVDAWPGSLLPFVMNVSFDGLAAGPGPTAPTAPNTNINKAPRKKTDKKVKVEFSSDDPAAGFDCKLDTGNFEHCTSPQKVKANKEGVHTLVVHAIGAGSIGPDASVRWKYKKADKH